MRGGKRGISARDEIGESNMKRKETELHQSLSCEEQKAQRREKVTS